jgi:hypothetical protein
LFQICRNKIKKFYQAEDGADEEEEEDQLVGGMDFLKFIIKELNFAPTKKCFKLRFKVIFR